jgi:hypothetical protein
MSSFMDVSLTVQSDEKGLLACSHQNWEDRLLLEACFYKFENISDSFALLLILVQ